jgi:hypothetical protein
MQQGAERERRRGRSKFHGKTSLRHSLQLELSAMGIYQFCRFLWRPVTTMTVSPPMRAALRFS